MGWPGKNRPGDEKCEQQYEIGIWGFEVQRFNNSFEARVLAWTESLSTFRTEKTVVWNMQSAVSTKHFLICLRRLASTNQREAMRFTPNLSAERTRARSP